MTKLTIKNHIRYHHGDLPVILSAPHGGFGDPEDIPNRTKGVFEQDDRTLELTEFIVKEFKEQTGKIPYALISEILRIKVDLNRFEDEAYEDPAAKKVYNQFHDTLINSRKEIEEKFGFGLYIDIHGQSHPKGYLEFGYLLKNDVLKQHDTFIKEHQDKSSIKTLSRFSKECFIDQIKGPHSLGSLMCNEGYDSIPSVKLPYASDGNYFEGAYDTQRYGSLDDGNISAIQIEFPYNNIRDSRENLQKCAESFVRSIIKFMEIHFDFKI